MQIFTQVFPTIRLDDHLAGLLSDCEVSDITTNTKRDQLNIHLHSTHLIHRNDITQLQEQIRSQLFSRRKIEIRIKEHYTLSAQYTPENLWHVYGESLVQEALDTNPLMGRVLTTARIRFSSPEVMQLSLEDTILSKGKEQELVSWLTGVFFNRCNLQVEIRTSYYEAQTSDLELFKQRKLASEIEQVLARTEAMRQEQRESAQTAEGDGDPAEAQGAPAGASDIGPEIPWEAGAAAQGISAEEMQHIANGGQVPSDGAQKPGAEGLSSAESAADGKASAGKEARGGRRKFAKVRVASDRGENEDLIFGRYFDGEDIPLEQVETEMGEIIFRGQVMKLETREIRNEKTIVIFSVTDYTDSITIKLFIENEELPDLLSEVKPGVCLKIRGITGIDRYDGELSIASVRGIRKIPPFKQKRKDNAQEKRVELHCHTKMSDMDGISSAKELVKAAMAFGHKALAITDHGVVHAFPEAFHTVRDAKVDPKDFKVIYGMEGYIVDDLIDLVVNEKGQSLKDSYVVFDLETTGFNNIHDKIIEIGAVKVVDGKITDRFSTYVNPKVPIPYKITELTSISDDMVMGSGTIEEILPQFLEFCGDSVMVAHNAGFDMGFIKQNCRYQDIEKEFTYVDTVALSRVLLPSLNKYKLDAVAKHLGISLEHHHRAVDDAECTAHIWLKLVELLEADKIGDLAGVNQLRSLTPDAIRKLPMYHIILLAKNEEGRKNLYRLVSMSHLTYFGKRPRLPKSEIIKHREGLIIGSACVSGELFQAMLAQKSEEVIRKIADFYDYLEVQPIANNRFLIEEDKYNWINTDEDLENLNREIIKLADEQGKMTVATCDVHFLNPEDEIGRRIIQAGNGYKDVDRPEPLFLRTTDEMLDEFSYLDPSKAYEIVVTNTNKINDMIEYIEPVRPDKCPPVIPDSDKILRETCYQRAHEIYGETLPDVVEKRLEKELNSIINNGFAVMYIIAQKLVNKSNEDGYLVGSRGSVGSSFVANMAGITEVNSLAPHYRCEHCFYVEFDSEDIKPYINGCGWDMPDKICPRCGKPLMKDGFNIPFETFLGFKGNKEPDIDLNFSGDYQAKAHQYTEVIFGQGQTFKAGTIGTVADKTAFGYTKHYFEERGIHKRTCEIERILDKCVGVRRSTGQHPGGIIVLPHGEEIHTFTPIQHPANDMTSDIVTTHFDYHSIDHNLLKLDILGHDDPTMIRRLEDLTGLNLRQVHLDDAGVLSLFRGTEALGITPEDIHGTRLGCMGIPEFGTDFVIQMLIDTQPKTFSDLVRISGLSHGTDVWLNNAQTLVAEGKTDLAGAICTRDDIMTYLINSGMDSEESFTIMENVRKGKVAKGACGKWPEWKEDMKNHGIPDWYSWSCERIKYMFPKAHAVAYVTMAFRIAYCKVNYPLAYYAAYFAIRANAFSYETMCRGIQVLRSNMEKLLHADKLSAKDQDSLKDMRLVEEMYARGLDFMPIDLYKAKAKDFQIIDGKIMPSFLSIDGMGEKAAIQLEEAAKNGPFSSKEDLKDRSKVPKSVIDKMDEMGLLKGMSESDQLSLFDFA